jgi:hypothetical protein
VVPWRKKKEIKNKKQSEMGKRPEKAILWRKRSIST